MFAARTTLALGLSLWLSTPQSAAQDVENLATDAWFAMAVSSGLPAGFVFRS